MSNTAQLRQLDDNGNAIDYSLGKTVLLYCLFDRIAGNYLPLFQAANDLVATREFKNVARNDVQGNTVASNTEDYDLYHVGTYDQRTAKITSREPQLVAAGLQIRNSIGGDK